MKMKSKNMRKKSVAILAGLAIAGTVSASAASLGGLNSNDLGADTGDVSSCDTNGVGVDYTTTFDAALGEYVVDGISLSDLNAACEGQDYDIVGLDGASLSIFTGSGTLALSGAAADSDADLNDGNTATVSVALADQFSASALESLALSISG